MKENSDAMLFVVYESCDECNYVFQGTRNTGNSIAGKNIANPCAMLLASAEMLDHIG